MYSLLQILAALALMIFMLNKRIHISYAVLAATSVLFILSGFVPAHLVDAIYRTAASFTTWNMVLTLYLVMCLEYLLRTSGILKNFTLAAGSLFRDNRIVLAVMPAFLGFLPSLGGALFSAPMVEEAAQPYNLSPEKKTAVNYWFRHVWEFCNPILPSLLLASSFTMIPIGEIVSHQFVMSFAAIFIGAVLMLRGKEYETSELPANTSLYEDNGNKKEQLLAVVLAIGPILLNVFFVTVCNMNTTLSMLLIVALLAVILRYRPDQWLAMFRDALNLPIITSILAILLFQGMLYATGTIDGLIDFFQSSGIPAAAVVYLTAFFMGLLTGLPQGFAAIAFPLILPMLGPGSLDALALTYICGLTGVMLSPAHLCLIVTVEYFHSTMFGSLKPTIIAQFLLLAFCFIWMTIF
ncbi:MAG: DUF401 family protein [Peptococcaceae bacterium]|nr:DUF401 family protein [Peptococcaceae bacterium]